MVREHHHFEFGHLLNRVGRALFAHAAVLEAAIGHEVGPPLGRRVDVQIARFHLFGEPHGPVDVLSEDPG